MPHTWIVWVHAQIVHSHIAIQEMSAIRSPYCLENFHISILGLRKHFQYVRRGYNSHDKTKLEIFSQTNNTQMEHCKKSAVTARATALLYISDF